MDDAARHEAGMAVRRATLGDDYVDHSLARIDDFNAPMQDLVVRHAWGDVWLREALDRRTRSLVTVAMLIALRQDAELKLHLRGAANNGASVEEIREVLLQAAVYCGVPVANWAFHIAEEIFGGARSGSQL